MASHFSIADLLSISPTDFVARASHEEATALADHLPLLLRAITASLTPVRLDGSAFDAMAALSPQILFTIFPTNFISAPGQLAKCSEVCSLWHTTTCTGELPYLIWSAQCRERCMCDHPACDLCNPTPYSVTSNIDYKALHQGGDVLQRSTLLD